MDELHLSGPADSKVPESLRQPVPTPREPAIAFFLSLLYPGLGQFYCGAKRRGFWILLFFTIGTAVVVGLFPRLSSPEAEGIAIFWGMGLRLALVLYGFAFLDAYFTAREMSEGISPLMEYNPRVAAVLNLLTRGFGYWYLDEKKKTVLLFFLVGAADRAATRMQDTTGTVLGIFVELALAAMAVDAYRLARKKNEKWLPSEVERAAVLQPVSGLQPGVPLGLAGVLVVGYAGLIGLSLVLPDYSQIDQSQAKVSETAEGKSYVNSIYAVEFHVPSDWEFDRSDKSAFIAAKVMEGGCHAQLVASTQFPFFSLEDTAEGLADSILTQMPKMHRLESKAAQLSGQPARELVFQLKSEANSEEGAVFQHYLIAQSGFSIYVLVFTVAEPFRDFCQKDVQFIRERVVLPQ